MKGVGLAALCALLTASTASWSQPPDGAPPEDQAAEQGQEAAPVDQPDGATSGAEADSVGSDSAAGPEVPHWLLGRWCLRWHFYVTIRDWHSAAMMPDGTRRRYRLYEDGGNMGLAVYLPAPAGNDNRGEVLGLFDPAGGESSFHSYDGQVIRRC